MNRTVKDVLLDWFVCRPLGHKIDWTFVTPGHGPNKVHWYCSRCNTEDPL